MAKITGNVPMTEMQLREIQDQYLDGVKWVATIERIFDCGDDEKLRVAWTGWVTVASSLVAVAVPALLAEVERLHQYIAELEAEIENAYWTELEARRLSDGPLV